ncbi:MAG TPA: zf-HC2 domain-containing protein, partial [Planctomycetota bacterium]|nr:zf-HC2 domain-containing protein [Planctomycetota bacterium]
SQDVQRRLSLYAQALVQRFASASLAPQERGALREHLGGCPGCAEHFERVAGTLARLGHEKRITRLAQEKALRRHSLRQDVFESGPSRNWMRSRLRTLVYPAFFALLMWGLSHKLMTPGGAQVQAQVADVWLRGQELAPGAQGVRMRVRERLFVGPAGHAQVQSGKTVWDLDPGAEVRLESMHPVSMRLFQGRVAVQGPFRCYSDGGVLIAKAACRANLQQTPAGLSVEILDGTAEWLHAEGSTQLVAGVAQTFAASDAR